MTYATLRRTFFKRDFDISHAPGLFICFLNLSTSYDDSSCWRIMSYFKFNVINFITVRDLRTTTQLFCSFCKTPFHFPRHTIYKHLNFIIFPIAYSTQLLGSTSTIVQQIQVYNEEESQSFLLRQFKNRMTVNLLKFILAHILQQHQKQLHIDFGSPILYFADFKFVPFKSSIFSSLNASQVGNH
ncbi:unnamed protein product [Paramecium primaurelia]|uniref:Uncharacterized protein n=1 Tax=Paramecium primaurelia TaxID=5886 RepID=A0A8S1KF95_PARPR|nr:unnamed protein product [Paramecium primaurelia]